MSTKPSSSSDSHKELAAGTSASNDNTDTSKHLDGSSGITPIDYNTVVVIQALDEFKEQGGANEEVLFDYIKKKVDSFERQTLSNVLHKLTEEDRVVMENSVYLLKDTGNAPVYPNWPMQPMSEEEYWKVMQSLSKDLQQSDDLWGP